MRDELTGVLREDIHEREVLSLIMIMIMNICIVVFVFSIGRFCVAARHIFGDFLGLLIVEEVNDGVGDGFLADLREVDEGVQNSPPVE